MPPQTATKIMKNLFLVSLVGTLVFLANTQALTIQGVNVPATATVSGETLQLNGAGVRTVTLAFIPIKAYVASFYSPEPLRSEQAVNASSGPLQFNFTFLQAASQSQVTDAWNAQFKASVDQQYSGLADDQAKFVAMFGPLGKGDVQTVEIDGNTTRVLENGKVKGTLDGKDFQRAFLSMWFGSNPVMPSLKTDLLGN